jgi:diguanylate cyclase (GGDEF)-like protein
VDLRKLELEERFKILESPQESPQLGEILREVFQCTEFTALPHVYQDEVAGWIVCLSDLSRNLADSQLNLLIHSFEMLYARNVMIRDLHNSELHDPVTRAYNRSHIENQLLAELARSRRIQLPLSLIRIKLTPETESNVSKSSGGAVAATHRLQDLMQRLASALKKTSRTNDIVGRYADDEMIVILPHTSAAGASLKAEKLRLRLQREALLGANVTDAPTVSMGVSEYPTHCCDIPGLLGLADEALNQVRTNGGNRVCVAAPPLGFQADFQVSSLAEAESKSDVDSESDSERSWGLE